MCSPPPSSRSAAVPLVVWICRAYVPTYARTVLRTLRTYNTLWWWGCSSKPIGPMHIRRGPASDFSDDVRVDNFSYVHTEKTRMAVDSLDRLHLPSLSCFVRRSLSATTIGPLPRRFDGAADVSWSAVRHR